MRKILFMLLVMIFMFSACFIAEDLKNASHSVAKSPFRGNGDDDEVFKIVLYERSLRETKAEFMERIMEKIESTPYIRVRPIYAKRLNCEGLPGGERLEWIAIYYEKEKFI